MIIDIFRIVLVPVKAIMFTVIFVNQLLQLALIAGGGFLIWKAIIQPFVLGGE